MGDVFWDGGSNIIRNEASIKTPKTNPKLLHLLHHTVKTHNFTSLQTSLQLINKYSITNVLFNIPIPDNRDHNILLILFEASSPALAVKRTYIVYLRAPSSFDGQKQSSAATAESHTNFLASFLKIKEEASDSIIYSYSKSINGFAAHIDDQVASNLADDPRVVSISLNKGKHLHTTHSWDFLALEKNGFAIPDSLWLKGRYGEDVIIGNLDTGVWPESKSFSDECYNDIPAKWNGICQNDHDDKFTCNKKLVGGRYFEKGYLAESGATLDPSMLSPRDHDGHGTHTLSTAGGNFVPGAVGNATAKGGSPKARVVAYKVCWPEVNNVECTDADILKAIEMDIHDGVDVLSMSLGDDTPYDYFDDGEAIGAFHAMKNGIVVVASAGNEGPNEGTVTNVAPWIITVGASTIDRGEFHSYVQLHNGQHIKGVSMSKALKVEKFYPLVTSVDAKAANASIKDANLCLKGTLDPKKVEGKILLCMRGQSAREDKGVQAALAGAVGMILANDKAYGDDIISDFHVLPATHITYTDGLVVYAYINSTINPMAYLTIPEAKFGMRPTPFMADFSSKGPNTVTPGILKPDITAPGVNIIAAFRPFTEKQGPIKMPFFILNGTSMSCPHVAGVVGLIKAIHPQWSPAAIKSAIMTTARTRDNTGHPMLDGFQMKATPLNYGAGHIRPNRATDPGLVYDLSVRDYMDFLCGVGYNSTMIEQVAEGPYECPRNYNILNFNYSSITVPKLNGSVTVSRILKNVGSPGIYTARIHSPPGTLASVQPSTLEFETLGEEKSFELTIKATNPNVNQDYTFGGLLWSDGKHYVRSPIVISVNAS